MHLRLVCSCGKGFQVLNAQPGKRFQCTACGAVVKVPGQTKTKKPSEERDDVSQYELGADEDIFDFDELEVDEYKVSRPRKKNRRRSKPLGMSQGVLRDAGKAAPEVLLRLAGLIIGAIGYLAVFLLMMGSVGGLLSGRAPGIGIFFVPLALCVRLGAQAATGRGLKVSRGNTWDGPGSIIGGIVIIIVLLALPFLVIYAIGLTLGA